MAEPTYIYVICSADRGAYKAPCKIGVSTRPEHRLRSIATACPFRCALFAVAGPFGRAMCLDIEETVHRLTAGRGHGEWFQVEPAAAVEMIRSVLVSGLQEILGDSKNEALAYARERIRPVLELEVGNG